jgi:virginiamycin A acetyltransferase
MRTLVKQCLFGLAILSVLPELILHALKVPILGKDRALEGTTEWLSLWPGLIGNYRRRAFLYFTIAHCHPTASIGFGTVFSKAGARIGKNAYIGSRCQLGWVDIGEDVLIASGVHVTSGANMHGTEDVDRPIREQEGVYRCVTIGPGSWVGSLTVVMADVGARCVIAAGAVVVQPIPPETIAGGVPAKVLKQRRNTTPDPQTT